MSLSVCAFARGVCAPRIPLSRFTHSFPVAAVRGAARNGSLLRGRQSKQLQHKSANLLQRRRLLATSSSAEPNPSSSSSRNAEESSNNQQSEEESTNHAVVSTFDLFSIGVGPSSR